MKTNTNPRLFRGCTSPEQGLDVAIFTGPSTDLYYVVLHQRFDRCGGPSGRVLDWWVEYAITPQGEVVAEAPPEGGAPATPPKQSPAPAILPPSTEGVPPPPESPSAPAPASEPPKP
ncbi:hypothetical protein ACLESO_44415 [Pyxidicoccus sp. 3LG]